jgi:hypothetical protein
MYIGFLSMLYLVPLDICFWNSPFVPTNVIVCVLHHPKFTAVLLLFIL